MIGKNYVFFSDLNTDTSKELTEKYFLDVYLGKSDREKVVSVDSENVMEKHYLKVKLKERIDCHEIKSKYDQLPFNGKVPKVSVFLGKD